MPKKSNRDIFKIMEPRYSIYHKSNKCFYCGDIAETIDHVPPISIAYSYGADALIQSGINLIKVSCCRDCNNLLNDKDLRTTDVRAKYLYERIQTKYRKQLITTSIDDEDLEDLGYNLRSYIERYKTVQDWVERRLSYIEDLFYDVI